MPLLRSHHNVLNLLHVATVTNLFFPFVTFLYFMTVMLLQVNDATKIGNVTARSHLMLTHFSCTCLQAVDGTKATASFSERLPQGFLMAHFFFFLT